VKKVLKLGGKAAGKGSCWKVRGVEHQKLKTKDSSVRKGGITKTFLEPFVKGKRKGVKKEKEAGPESTFTETTRKNNLGCEKTRLGRTLTKKRNEKSGRRSWAREGGIWGNASMRG